MDASRGCLGCGGTFPSTALACPGCGRLVHAATLKRLVATADEAKTNGDRTGELGPLREALALLPQNTRQHQLLSERVTQLSEQLAGETGEAGRQATPAPSWAKRLGPLGVVLLALWKVKFLVLGVLSKGKLLLVGLTNASTFFSMLLAMGTYWALFGWKFGVGLIASIYVHEMGHVAALRRFGLPASAPMFIPGVGAFVRLQSRPATPVEDARVGLAGPMWGTVAAMVCWALSVWFGGASSSLRAIAQAGAFINLLNLLPIWQFDGSRAFSALNNRQRWLVALAFGGAWVLTQQGLVLVLAGVAGVRAARRDPNIPGDLPTLVRFVVLIVILAILWVVSGTAPR